MKFVARWIITAIAVAIAVNLVGGVVLVGGTGWGALAAFALVLAFVDTVVKPIFKILTIPISFLTLGVFYLFINTIMLYVAASLSGGLVGIGLEFANFGTAFLCSIIISVVSAIANALISD